MTIRDIRSQNHAATLIYKNGNFNPFLPAPSGPALLADLDFSTPVTQSFGSSNATHRYLLQETSGNYADTGTGTAADIDTFVTGYQGQAAPGVWNGSSYVALNAWETSAATSLASVSDSSVFDSNNTDLYFRSIFRFHDNDSVGKRIMSKRTGTNAGWDVILNSTGTINVTIEDDLGNSVVVTVTGNHGDGALHYIEFFYDASADEITVNTDLDSGNSATSTAAVTGTLTTAANWTIGNTSGVARLQWLMCEGAEGAAAATMFAETGWWTHASDPTGLLTTQTRGSLISVPVANGYVGHFTDDTLPIGWHSAFSDTNKLGLYCNSAVTNLAASSEDFTSGWTNSGTTDTANSADAPDGFRSATLLTATATNGQIRDSFTVSTDTEYTLSVWIKESTPGATGRVIFYDATGAAEIAATAYTATGTWQRVSVTGTTPGFIFTGRLDIEIDTDTESIYIWGAQAELGSDAGAYIRTSGASAALTACDYIATGTAGQWMKSATGEIEAVHVLAKRLSGNKYVVTAYHNVNEDIRSIGYQVTGTTCRGVVYDDAGVLAASINNGTETFIDTEVTTVLRWDAAGALAVGGGADAEITFQGIESATDIGTFDASNELIDTLVIGNWRSGSSEMDGFIQRVRVWDAEGGAA
jgi:hypothetical protein